MKSRVCRNTTHLLPVLFEIKTYNLDQSIKNTVGDSDVVSWSWTREADFAFLIKAPWVQSGGAMMRTEYDAVECVRLSCVLCFTHCADYLGKIHQIDFCQTRQLK